jgi:WD40 repeat protein
MEGPTQGIAFSADGTFLLSCGGTPHATLHVWEAKNGKEKWQRNLGVGAQAVAAAQDGRTIAVACDDGTVRLCNAADGAEQHQLQGHKGSVTAVAFTPDHAKVISAGRDGTVRFWERKTGRETQRLAVPGHALRCLALSPDGTLLAAGTENLTERARSRLVVWKLPSGKERKFRSYNDQAVLAVAFSRDGKTLAVGGESMVITVLRTAGERWESYTIHPYAAWNDIPGPLLALSFGADGRTMACLFSLRDTVYVCDSVTGRLRQRPLGTGYTPPWHHPPNGRPLAFSPDGRALAVGGKNQAVHLLTVSSGEQRLFGATSSP